MKKSHRLFYAAFLLMTASFLGAQPFTSYQITNNAAKDEQVDAAVDSRGIPHAVYQRAGSIYYKQGIGAEILIGAGTLPAIALDPNGIPHVVYISSGQVMYTTRKGGAWQTAVVVSDGNSADIDVDANGFAHIVYTKSGFNEYEVYYAHNKSGVFVSSLKWGGNNITRLIVYRYLGGIKIDSLGYYHIVQYRDYNAVGYPSWGIREMTNKSGVDVITSLDTGLNNVALSKNSVAIDGTGKAHIVYSYQSKIYHAWIEGGWQEAVVQTGIDTNTAAAAIAAKGNTIGIVYKDASSNVKFIQDSGSGFGAPLQIDTGGAAVVGLGSTFIYYVKSDGTDDEIYLKTDKDLNPNLVGYWKFDTAADLGQDSSAYGNHGTVTATDVTSSPAGKVGGSAKFIEGRPDVAIEVPNSASLDITGGITIAAWIKRDGNDVDGGDAIVSKGKAGTTEQYGFYAHHPLAQFQTSAFFNGTWQNSGSAINSGTWYHAAMTYDGTTVKFYKDGALVATKSCAGGLVSNTSSLFIGASPMPNPEDYSGLMDELRIYNKVLTLSEIQTLQTYSPLSMTLSKSTLTFGVIAGGSATQLNLPPPFFKQQSVIIGQTGTGTLNWEAKAASPQGWLGVAPWSGTGTGVLQVSVPGFPEGLAVGTYPGTVFVTDPNASNSPQAIAVTLVVKGAGTTSAPFGDFATPIDGTAGITGAIPVTGWVLDDIETNRVRIKRDPHALDPPGAIGPDGLVFIGDAIFVEGARPDVELAYPSYPLNSRAGWGYMLLTNFLPNQGNGTYKIYAYASDPEGNTALLGTKTIICANATAVKPFGTIDTPAQGGDASGSTFVNFGWVLTPMPKTVPKDGSTIDVYVDGVKVGNLATAPNVYNQYRVDVATAFPGLNNTSGPVGAFYLNTTTYPNGVHTIFWIATDNAAAADGIGSRYFNIVNTGSAEKIGAAPLLPVPDLDDVRSLPLKFEPLRVRTGFNLKGEPESLAPDAHGVYHVEIPEVNRVEIDLRSVPETGKALAGLSRCLGYLVVGNELRPLPIGSTLDARTGLFSWLPGPGFLGRYELVFIKGDPSGVKKRVQIEVTIGPKFKK